MKLKRSRMAFLWTTVLIHGIAASSLCAAPFTSPFVPGLDRVNGLEPNHAGRVLLNELNCTACHQAGDGALQLPPRSGPDLSGVAERLRADYLREFLADPLGVRPGTTMPDVLGGRETDEREAIAEALTHFLASRSSKPFDLPMPDEQPEGTGKQLYHGVGCVACHPPRDGQVDAKLVEKSIPLDRLAEKYSLGSLVAFLEDPLAVRPGGRMPSLNLKHWEAVDIANYLFEGATVPENPEPFTLDPQQVELGQKYYSDLGCVQCHPLEGMPQTASLPALADLDPGKGCLSGGPGNWPAYSLSKAQRTLLRDALTLKPLTETEQVNLTLTALNCVTCHQRDALGGVEPERNDHFQSSDLNLGEAGRIPPALTLVGAKLKPAALREALLEGKSVRRYMKTRMPVYGENNVGHLVGLFDKLDHLPPAPFEVKPGEKSLATEGALMVGSKGLNCIVCHSFNEFAAEGMQAIKLELMAERLEKDWLYQFLQNPQKFRANIVMPSFWPAGMTSRPDILEGKPDVQIQAVWEWMLGGSEARIPAGYKRPQLKLVVGDEPYIFRRAIGGVGKRGISVGYPGGINLAFDAQQMRLAWVWRGDFLDASGVWYGQGQGQARIIGENRIEFPAGAPFAVLASPEASWPEVVPRPEGFQFKGYRLDEEGRPVFMYQFQDVSVEDFFVANPDAQTLERRLTFKPEKGRDGLYLRVAMEPKIEQLASDAFRIAENLIIHLSSPAKGLIRPGEKESELIVPIAVKPETTTLELRYVWTIDK